EPEMPKWMARIEAFTPAKSAGLGAVLGAANPKNLALTVGAAAGLGQLGLSTSAAVVSLIVFVAVGSLTIAGPVAYYLVGGEKSKGELDNLKNWLGLHNDAVMAVLFLVFGVALIAKGIPPTGSLAPPAGARRAGRSRGAPEHGPRTQSVHASAPRRADGRPPDHRRSACPVHETPPRRQQAPADAGLVRDLPS